MNLHVQSYGSSQVLVYTVTCVDPLQVVVRLCTSQYSDSIKVHRTVSLFQVQDVWKQRSVKAVMI